MIKKIVRAARSFGAKNFECFSKQQTQLGKSNTYLDYSMLLPTE